MNAAPDRMEAVEALLVSKREDLLREIRAQASEFPIEDASPDERFQLMKRRKEVVGRLDVLTRTIAHIDAALHGIADGSYGTCANCGSPISEKRLRSIPWAIHCLQCQEQLERLAEASSRRLCHG